MKRCEVDRDKLSPGIKQYMEIKDQYPDELLFYRLISKGYKVAICEQLEDPKSAKGVVKRGVTNVYSKGSIVDAEMLKEYENNYIGSVIDCGINYVLTFGDISTG